MQQVGADVAVRDDMDREQLRLIEARRRMLAQGEAVSDAAYGVGYESVPQFTREYGRMFGQPPAHDIRHTRADGCRRLETA